MRATLMALGVCLLAGAGSARAEDWYIARDICAFCTKTTEQERLAVPVLPLGAEDERRHGKGVELKAEWLEGGGLRDVDGRVWYRYRGPAFKAQPATVSGWIVKSDMGREYFYTKDGQLLGLGACPPTRIFAPVKVKKA